jgi:hypothetical protein
MLSLVGALYKKCSGGASPEGSVRTGNPGAPGVAVFIQAYDGSGTPPSWQGHSGDIVYDSPASYRVTGFVSIDT